MRKRSGSSDPIKNAMRVVEEAIGEPIHKKKAAKKKNAAAVALGRLGGLKGGKARAEKLGKEALHESAVNAARIRWERERQRKQKS